MRRVERLPSVAGLLVVALAACGSKHLAGPDFSDAGDGPTSAPGRDAGAGTDDATAPHDAATADAANADGAKADGAGVDGATPLPISGLLAEERVANVLWTAAGDAELLPWQPPTTKEELAADVRKMLADPRATVGVGAFYRWWLDLADVDQHVVDPSVLASATPALLADMDHETERFGVDVTLTMAGTLETLMTSPLGFVDASLASIYGISGVTDDDLQAVTLPAGRPGVLTRAAFLTEESYSFRTSPVTRGRFVATKFFCSQIPAPPPEEPPIPAAQPGVTGRAALEALIAQNGTACPICHQFMDPLGFAFEGFDAVGRARATDNGAPVDTSMLTIAQSTPPNAVVDGADALVSLMAKDPGVEACFARQWLAFALGETFDQVIDADVTPLYEAFRAASFNLQELIVAVLTSDAFLVPPPPLRTQ